MLLEEASLYNWSRDDVLTISKFNYSLFFFFFFLILDRERRGEKKDAHNNAFRESRIFFFDFFANENQATSSSSSKSKVLLSIFLLSNVKGKRQQKNCLKTVWGFKMSFFEEKIKFNFQGFAS